MPAQMGFPPRRPGGLSGGLPRLGQASGYGGIAQGAIQQGQQAGAFNPMGSPQIQQALQQGALRRAESLRHRGETTASLAGLDPQSARQSLFNMEGQIGGDTSNFLSDAHLQELMGNRDWLRQLFGGQLGNEQDRQMAQLQAKLQKQAQGGGFLSGVGNLLGTAGGAFLSAGAPGLGGFLGGGGGSGWHPFGGR